jgi:CheY-like chemotaxis protein
MTDTDVDILLVEDDPNDVQLTLHALAEHKVPLRVEVARDGAEALDFLFCSGPFAARQIEDGPKLVLLDLKLPLVDGVEVLRQVKADSRTQMIPVVVLTSSREERDIAQSYRLGVNSYVVKPVDFDKFATALQQVGLYWLSLNQPPLSRK